MGNIELYEGVLRYEKADYPPIPNFIDSFPFSSIRCCCVIYLESPLFPCVRALAAPGRRNCRFGLQILRRSSKLKRAYCNMIIIAHSAVSLKGTIAKATLCRPQLSFPGCPVVEGAAKAEKPSLLYAPRRAVGDFRHMPLIVIDLCRNRGYTL